MRKSAREAEATLERLTAQLEELEASLANPSLYEGEAADVAALQTRHAELRSALHEAEDRWLRAQEAYEAATTAEP